MVGTRIPVGTRKSLFLTHLFIVLAAVGAGVGGVRAAENTALRLSNVDAGNNAYVRVANGPGFTLTAFTLEAWIQRIGPGYGHTTDGLGAGIISKPQEGVVGSYLGSWHLNWTNSGQMVFTVVHTLGSAGVYLTTPAVATPLGRHHLAASFDGDTLRAYVDGALAVQAAWNLGSVYYGPEDVLIGAQNFGSGFVRGFDGFIDDVRVWNYARTPAQIATYMNCRQQGNEAGLVAYWTFDAFNLADATGHGHGGTIGGIPASLTYAPLATIQSCAATGVDEPAAPIAGVSAMDVFPQPTAGVVTARFDLAREGLVTAELFEVGGRKVATLASRHMPAGRQELTWDLTTLGVAAESTRMLYLRLQASGRTIIRPLVMVR